MGLRARETRTENRTQGGGPPAAPKTPGRVLVPRHFSADRLVPVTAIKKDCTPTHQARTALDCIINEIVLSQRQ